MNFFHHGIIWFGFVLTSNSFSFFSSALPTNRIVISLLNSIISFSFIEYFIYNFLNIKIIFLK